MPREKSCNSDISSVNYYIAFNGGESFWKGMKILFLANVPLENPMSGSELVLSWQATGLAKEGMDVYAITRQTGPPSWIIRNLSNVHEGCFHVSVQNMTRSFLSLVKYPLQFHRRFRQDTPFQASISHQPLNCFMLLIMRKLRSTLLLYVFHSPSHEEYLLGFLIPRPLAAG